MERSLPNPPDLAHEIGSSDFRVSESGTCDSRDALGNGDCLEVGFSVACDGAGSQSKSSKIKEASSPHNDDQVHTEVEECRNNQQKQGKYFCYDSPLPEDTGVWIPVSVPPMLEGQHEDWTRRFHSDGSYFPEGDMGWKQYIMEERDLTMWDVVVEMLLAARGKASAVTSGDVGGRFSWMSPNLLELAWQEMAQTLTEASFENVREIIEADPPKWMADSAACACMLCGVRFHPIMRSRHHCRFCGGIFCGECSRGRSLLPTKFRVSDPQRVCDVCCVRLESVQPYLMDQVSHASQLPTQDLTDLSTLRSWINFPWGQSMEHEIYKATNAIRGYSKRNTCVDVVHDTMAHRMVQIQSRMHGFIVDDFLNAWLNLDRRVRHVQYGCGARSLKPEKEIPNAILREAKGLAIITVVKVGTIFTYRLGTGLVVARREDGSWSPPSAISTFGVGWGAQAGWELTDFIIVLRTAEAVMTFSGNAHLSFGAGLSAAAGIIGRTLEADMLAGVGGCSACYTYSRSKGAFVGCSLQGSVVMTRSKENCRFYGSHSLSAADILLGSMPQPPAASALYDALEDMYQKMEI